MEMNLGRVYDPRFCLFASDRISINSIEKACYAVGCQQSVDKKNLNDSSLLINNFLQKNSWHYQQQVLKTIFINLYLGINIKMQIFFILIASSPSAFKVLNLFYFYSLFSLFIMLKFASKAIFSTLANNKILKQGLELTKFKLSVLNGIVTIGAYSLYSTPVSCIPLFLYSVALSMSTQALNQYIEVQLDRKMLRTSQRPLVKGLNPNIALGLGLGLGAVGFAGLMSYNTLTAGIGATIWASYLFLYTRMKKTSQFNTFVGAIIGSLPVYLGWVASGRSFCMVQPFAIFIYMIAWQYQHFYGIRWIYYDDYNNAGFRMEKDKKVACAQVMGSTVLSMVLINYSLHYFGVMNCFVLGIPLTLGLYRWGIKSTLAFSRDQISAKQFKMQSYKHFMLVLGIFIICGVFSRWSKQEKVKRNKTKVRFQQLMNVYL